VRYMPIVPVGMLDVLAVCDVQDVFILSQYWHIKEYREFYCKHQWRSVVLDNALYEDPTATSFDKMVGMANQLSADVVYVVGPEKLNSGIQTGQMTRDILKEYESDGTIRDNIFMMCILHERPNEMLSQWNMVKEYENLALGISIFSYRLGYDRGSLHKFLNLPASRYVHAFGWDNLLETYNMVGRFGSVDSSMCVSAAVNTVNLRQNWQITRNDKMDGMHIGMRVPIDTSEKALKEQFKSGLNGMKYHTCKNIRFLTEHARIENPIYRESELP
jgi:hypothetical protein